MAGQIIGCGGGLSGSGGTAGRVALWASATGLTSDAGITWSGTGANADLTSGSFSVSATNIAGSYSTLYRLQGGRTWELQWTNGAALGGSTDLGLARESAGILKVTNGGVGNGAIRAHTFLDSGSTAALAYGDLLLGSGRKITFNSADSYGATPDTGLARASAGTLKVTSGGSNLGSLQAGNVTATALGTPASPVITNVGTTGATTYGYRTIAYLNDGTHSAPNGGDVTATGNATLDGTNFNRLTWPALTNAAYYEVYRVVSGGTPASVGKIWTGAALTMDDTGLAGDTSSIPTTNTTGRVLVEDGSAAAPSVAAASNPTTGLFFSGGGTPYFAIGGAAYYTFAQSRFELGTDRILLSSSNITAPAGATLQLGAAPNAAPVANTLIIGESGSGTNVAGANGTISSGIGTGSGTGSQLIFQTPAAGGSGSGAQTPVTRMTIDGNNGVGVGPALYPLVDEVQTFGFSSNRWTHVYVSRATLGSKQTALTDATATTFATFTIADTETYTGEIIYKVKAVKGTALQALAGRARFAATREGTTYTVSIGEVGTQVLAAATGTLTGALEISATAGVVTLKANFDTSFASPDSFTMAWRFDSPDAALSITPVP